MFPRGTLFLHQKDATDESYNGATSTEKNHKLQYRVSCVYE